MSDDESPSSRESGDMERQVCKPLGLPGAFSATELHELGARIPAGVTVLAAVQAPPARRSG